MKILNSGLPSSSPIPQDTSKQTVYGGANGNSGKLVPIGDTSNPNTINPSVQSWPATPEEKDKEELKKLAERLSQNPIIQEKRLKFKVHDDTGELYVEITDANSGKKLTQIPPQELLDMEARLKDMNVDDGLLVDSKV